MGCRRYLTYSILQLAGAIVTVGLRGVARLFGGRPTVLEQECAGEILRFGRRTFLTAGAITFLYGLIATYVILSQAPSAEAYEALVLPYMGGIFIQYVIPVAIANLVVIKGVVAITSDIASMRVSQEVQALEAAGLHPAEMIFAPRALALLLAAPTLAAMGVYSAFFGAWLGSSLVWKPGLLDFLGIYAAGISLPAFAGAILKVTVIAFVMSVIGGYFGFNARRVETGEIGRTTTMAVVASVVGITIINLLFSLLGSILPSA